MLLRNSSSLESSNTTEPHNFTLFPLALQLLQEDFDIMGTILSIIDSYILLDANLILQVSSVSCFFSSKVTVVGARERTLSCSTTCCHPFTIIKYQACHANSRLAYFAMPRWPMGTAIVGLWTILIYDEDPRWWQGWHNLGGDCI